MFLPIFPLLALVLAEDVIIPGVSVTPLNYGDVKTEVGITAVYADSSSSSSYDPKTDVIIESASSSSYDAKTDIIIESATSTSASTSEAPSSSVSASTSATASSAVSSSSAAGANINQIRLISLFGSLAFLL